MSLFLSHLTLSHFRSHHRAIVEVDARPVALFGPNGAGKTNLLEAVSLFSPGRGMRRASAQEMTRRPEAIGWKITGLLHSDGHPHDIAFQSEAGTARSLRIDNKTSTQAALGQLARVVWLVPAMDRLWIEGAEGRRRFLDRLTLGFFPTHGEAVLSYERAMRDRNRLLKDQVRDTRWFTALEAQMAHSALRIGLHRAQALSSVLAAQAEAQTAFPVADLWIEHPDAPLPETEEGLRQALTDSRPRDLQAGRSLVGPHRVDLNGVYAEKGVAARDCSTGEQKALLISLILSTARALAAQDEKVPIVLLDEVAAHLDPDRRRALYDEICDLGVQAWMTGTEPALFADLGERAQYLEVTALEGVSQTRGVRAPFA